ncbi:hypothetical protein LTR17_021777 [Elasticomyces elasticus]|nr:hypothetical protein LTR17_021777 [Elasticomyces elasticus]
MQLLRMRSMATATTMDDSMEKMTSLTLTDNTTEVTYSPPLRGVFSLPRELRDQIYGYLLLHEYTRAPPYHTRDNATHNDHSKKDDRVKSTVRTFRFHVNLLRTNRAINNEAAHTLALNRFVVVSAKWLQLRTLKHLHGLPIVCEDPAAVAKFSHHIMRVHTQSGYKEDHVEGMTSFVIVAADLPIFCGTLMQWIFLLMASPSNILMHARSGTLPELLDLQSPATIPPAITTKIQLRSTVARHKVDALRALMGPETVSLSPIIWRAFEVAASIKGAADELLAKNDAQHALRRYQLVVNGVQQSFLWQLTPHIYRAQCQVPLALLLRKAADAAVIAGFLALSLDDFSAATNRVRDVLGFEEHMKSCQN